MPIRLRKLIGAIALLLLIFVYALLAMLVAIVLQVREVGGAAQLAYYALAGLLWVPPAAGIIWWMQQEPGRKA